MYLWAIIAPAPSRWGGGDRYFVSPDTGYKLLKINGHRPNKFTISRPLARISLELILSRRLFYQKHRTTAKKITTLFFNTQSVTLNVNSTLGGGGLSTWHYGRGKMTLLLFLCLYFPFLLFSLTPFSQLHNTSLFPVSIFLRNVYDSGTLLSATNIRVCSPFVAYFPRKIIVINLYACASNLTHNIILRRNTCQS